MACSAVPLEKRHTNGGLHAACFNADSVAGGGKVCVFGNDGGKNLARRRFDDLRENSVNVVGWVEVEGVSNRTIGSFGAEKKSG